MPGGSVEPHATSSFPLSSSAYHLHAPDQALHRPLPLPGRLSSLTTITAPLYNYAMSNGLPDEVVTCLQNARFVSPARTLPSHLSISGITSTTCLIPKLSSPRSSVPLISPRSSNQVLVFSSTAHPHYKHVLFFHAPSTLIRTYPVLIDTNSSILQHARTISLMSRS
jgi:hypothetical protein